MKMKMNNRTPFLRVSAVALTCSVVGLWWVLMWAPTKDEELFATQNYIEECRKAGHVPVYWDGAKLAGLQRTVPLPLSIVSKRIPFWENILRWGKWDGILWVKLPRSLPSGRPSRRPGINGMSGS